MKTEVSQYSEPLGLYLNCIIKNGSVNRLFVTRTPEFEVKEDLILDRINDYLFGKTDDLSDIKVAPEGTDFQKSVWSALRDIPRGDVKTYSDIAKEIGKPGAARAVGNAVGSNNILILIPCHRVIGKHGLGGFSAEGGIKTKKKILAAEDSIAMELGQITG